MTYEDVIERIKATGNISIISEKEIQHGKSITLSNGSIINCFNTGKHNIQGKNAEQTKGILGESTKLGNRKIFVVYGHDDIARTLLEALLRRWDLEPIILDQQASGGQTIIEKLEEYSQEAGYAIVVIAVNCCYDTIVNDDIIHEGSVHGQFLTRFADSDEKRQALDAEIDKSLTAFGYGYTELSANEKRYGKRKRYPLGSVARIKGKNGVTFFLFALTQFDFDCVAHCDKHKYFDCMLKLFEYYDKHGQGKELYLYTMGTSMSRTGLSREEALQSIILLSKISKNMLKTKTTIVVDSKCKNELSITDL